MNVPIRSAAAARGPGSCRFEGPKAMDPEVQRGAPWVMIEWETNLVAALIWLATVAEGPEPWGSDVPKTLKLGGSGSWGFEVPKK